MKSSTKKTKKTVTVRNLPPVRKLSQFLKVDKTVNQKIIAEEIAIQLKGKVTLADIERVLSMEQTLTVEYLRKGYRVCKRDFLTLEPRYQEGTKEWTSPLNRETYEIPARMKVCVRVGRGLKNLLIDAASEKEAKPEKFTTDNKKDTQSQRKSRTKAEDKVKTNRPDSNTLTQNAEEVLV